MMQFKGRSSPVVVTLMCALLLATLTSLQLHAQIATARIAGTVTDPTGAVITHVAITLTNVNTGIVQTAASNSTGTYVFSAVLPGNYTIRATSPSFKQYVGENIQLHVQDNVNLNIPLVPGGETQQVIVTDAEPQLSTADASVGQLVDTMAVNDLPLNGRNWGSLAQLAAGVTTVAGGAPGTPVFVEHGLNFGQNDYRLDGINDNVEVYGATAFGTMSTVTPPPDAIQEFKIQTGNYSAEVGHSAGGVVNAVVKSGTNSLHGDVWEYLRNNMFDANDYFSKQYNQPIPSYHQNQYGGTIGGPVFIPKLYDGRNRSFFFFDYQGTRIVHASPSTSTVPTPSMQDSTFTNLQDLITDNSGTGTDALGRTIPLGTVLDPATTRTVAANGVDPVTGLQNPTSSAIYVRDPFYSGGSAGGIKDFTGHVANLNQLPAGRFDPNAVAALKLFPARNADGLLNNYHNNSGGHQNVDQADVRIDQNIGSRDVLFGVFDKDHITYTTPPNLPGLAVGQNFYAGITDGPHYIIAVGYTHIFTPTLTNQFTFGFNHSGETIAETHDNVMGVPAQFGIQGIPQLPGNGGLSPIAIGGISGIGVSQYTPIIAKIWDLELQDNVTKLVGKHAFKAGYQLDSIEGDVTAPPESRGFFNYSGQFTDIPNASAGLTGMADFLLTPTAATVTNGIPNMGGLTGYSGSNFEFVNNHRYYTGLYVQDDWKIAQKLTLNLGVRLDFYTPYFETSGRQANFIQDGGNGATGTYYVPTEGCKVPRSTSFDTLLASSNIKLSCNNDLYVGNAQKTNFAPRLGFAYTFAPKAVVRGGYGIAYGALGNQATAQIGFNYPFEYSVNYQSPSSNSPLVLANGATATMENAFAATDLQNPLIVAPEGLQLAGRQYNYTTPYTQTYNLAFQYQIASHDSVEVGYVGTKGRHLDDIGSHNSPNRILPPGENPYDAVPFPNFALNSGYVSTDSSSDYDSLQVIYRRQLSAGLELLANYTYSRCMSNQELNTGDFNNPPGFRAQWLPGFGIAPDYALCITDSTNVVHVSGTYQLPFGRNRAWLNHDGRLVDSVLGGWSGNFIYTYQGGEPFTVPCAIATTSDFGCDANLVSGQSVSAGAHTAKQWLNPSAFATPPVATQAGQTDFSVLGGPPQQVRGPGFNNLDFSVFKQFQLEKQSFVQFRAEAFNLSNTAQFAQPGNLNYLNPANFAPITALVNQPRILQFALKVVF